MGVAFGVFIAFLSILTVCRVEALEAVAHVNMAGIRGNITFIQMDERSNVTILVSLESYNEAEKFKWSIAPNLVQYEEKDRCNKRALGNRAVTNFADLHGELEIPTNGTASFIDHTISLHGAKAIWDKSILLEGGSKSACTNIIANAENTRTAEARFNSGVAGSVIFRQVATNTTVGTFITVDLFHSASDSPQSTTHDWRLLASDLLDKRASRRRSSCHHLTTLYDPNNANNTGCSRESPHLCKIGDLTLKHGQVTVGAKRSRYSRSSFFDSKIPLPDLTGPRLLYVVIFDSEHPNEILSCAQMLEVQPKESEALLEWQGLRGHIRFSQRSPYDPMSVTVSMENLRDRGVYYHIHEFPVPPKTAVIKDGKPTSSSICSETGKHFNPFGVKSASPGNGTFDEYEIGDLSGKYGTLSGESYNDRFLDPYLFLYGPHSIAGRSIVVHQNDSSRWTCGNIAYPGPTITAVARFFYPVVGRIIFRTELNDPLASTSLFIESLTYGDGTLKDPEPNNIGHRWSIHRSAPNRDFFGWEHRCVSANEEYNPYSVNKGQTSGYKADCNAANSIRCSVGDLTPRFGRVFVSITTAERNVTKAFFHDYNLPLAGVSSIIGKSIIIFDDHAPDFRGNRMACTTIYKQYTFRAHAHQWHPSGSPSNISGRLEFLQETEYDITRMNIDMKGFNKLAASVHIHEVSVPIQLVFPCTNDAIYAHINPFGIVGRYSPPPGTGSQDEYEIGDLSGKYGAMLDGQDMLEFDTLDTNLPLQGPITILQRSVVVHKADQGHRWVCADILPDIREEGVRYAQAIASFHHPNGFAQGYIRFSQVIYADGSMSDTVIEVNVRHPGKNDRNVTTGHQWGVYVNPVGEDAAVKSYIARCLASGFRWNPFLTKREDEVLVYKDECNIANPLRCEMGDLGSRLGPMDVGGQRKVFIDSNLPLAGNYSVLKRSIVIKEKNGDNNNFACANIEPDVHIVEKLRVKKSKRFSEQAFVEEVRKKMAVPEWYLFLDAKETKDVGNCAQLSVHFRGPDANKLQYDFNILMNTGRVNKLYAAAPGTVIKKDEEFHYRECRTFVDDSSDANGLYFETLIYSFTLLICIAGIC